MSQFARNIAPMIVVTISVFVIISWQFERARHWKIVKSTLFDPDQRDHDEGDSDDDPYNIGMNDKDIL